MTYGEIKFRLTKLFPGVDVDVLSGWIADRYTQILDRLPWQRQKSSGVLTTAAPYTTGTVAVTNGSTALTLAGGTWTAAMSGRKIRLNTDDEFYTFTRLTNTTGTLDRAYIGTTDAEATYRIFQPVYALASTCKALDRITSFSYDAELERTTPAELDRIDAARSVNGSPDRYALTFDDSSDPPLMQVELWPVPDDVYAFPYGFSAELTTPTRTATTILPWVRPRALIEGVSADAWRHQKDVAGYEMATKEYEAAVADMIRTECENTPSEQMRMASRFTRHRARRWQR